MQNDPAGFAIEQQILSAPANGANGATGDPTQEIAWYWPSERAVAYHHAANALALHVLGEPAARGLHFRKLGHAEALLLCNHVRVEQTLTDVDAEVIAHPVVVAYQLKVRCLLQNGHGDGLAILEADVQLFSRMASFVWLYSKRRGVLPFVGPTVEIVL